MIRTKMQIVIVVIFIVFEGMLEANRQIQWPKTRNAIQKDEEWMKERSYESRAQINSVKRSNTNTRTSLEGCQNEIHEGPAKREADEYTRKSRPADKRPCPDEMRDDGTSCWKDSYGRGAGRVPDKEICPSNQRDDGISCWLDNYGRGAGRLPDITPCPSGMRDNGTSCLSDAHVYGKGCCCTLFGCCNICPSGYHDDGCTCRKTDIGIKLTLLQRQGCKSDEEMNGRLCYPKCKEGYHASGCCICTPNGGPGIRKTLAQRQSCRSDEERVAELCYPKCRDGYRPEGCCICEPNDGPGIKVTLPARLYCKDNEIKLNGVCWETCQSGYSDNDNGGVCRKICR